MDDILRQIEEQKERDHYAREEDRQREAVVHEIVREGIDYDVDQPMGWEIICTCGERFDHSAPEGARDAYRRHLSEREENDE